jgi:hypothetical protein
VEPRDAPSGPPSDAPGAEAAFGLARPLAPWWANRHLRLGLLLACLLAALLALLNTRAAWFGLGDGSGQAGPLQVAAGCPSREAPLASIATPDLAALRDELSRIMPAPVGRVYEVGPIITSYLWSDEEPRFSPSPGSSAPAGYEVRWWALDRRGSEDDVAADVLEFETSREAQDVLALAASPHCRRDGAAHAVRYPAGARELSWMNPDGARQLDVMFARGRRLYRVGDVPPGYLLDTTGPRQGALERARAGRTADALACALPDAGCPHSTASLRDTSLAALTASSPNAVGGPPPTTEQATAYAHAVNLRGYDLPGKTPVAPEGPTQDRGYWEAFVRCTGELRSTHPLAAIHSPEFRYRSRRSYELVYSTVAVLPSRATAARFMGVLESQRARACMASDYEGLLRARAAQGGMRALGPVTLTRLATTAPPSYRGPGPYRATAVRLMVQASYATHGGGREQLPLYVEGFAFARGRAVVELTSLALVQPISEEGERFLESLLVGAAEASEASL